jgi:hypothetical protein
MCGAERTECHIVGVGKVWKLSIHTCVLEGLVYAILLQAPHCIDSMFRVPHVWGTTRYLCIARLNKVPGNCHSWALHCSMSWSSHLVPLVRILWCVIMNILVIRLRGIASKAKAGGMYSLQACLLIMHKHWFSALWCKHNSVHVHLNQ